MPERVTATSTAASGQRFLALDGLRGLAAVIVVLFHKLAWVGTGHFFYGYLAVDFFFMLSGFVIGHAYGERLAERRIPLGRFALLRAERLGPLILLGAWIGLMGEWLYAGLIGQPGRGIEASAAFPFALTMIPAPWLERPFPLNHPAWSLYFELVGNFAFALLAPMLTTRRLAILVAVLGAALAGVALMTGTLQFGWRWEGFSLGYLRMAFPFALGILLERLWAAQRLPRWRVPFWALALALAVLLSTPEMSASRTGLYEALCVFALFPLLLVAACQAEPAGRWRGLAELSAEISYPVYILHIPVLDLLMRLHGRTVTHPWIMLALELALLVCLSLLASRRFDGPMRQWLKSRRTTAPASA